MRYVHTLLFVASLGPLACGRSQPPAAPAEGTDPTATGDAPGTADAPITGDAPPPAETSVKFKDMNHDERLQLMRSVVVPEMTIVFQGHDAEHFAEVNCATCHGPGAGKGEFEMPSEALPKLPAHGAFQALKETNGKMVEFMAMQVVPKMASLLGEEPFDPATGNGFGCYDCHMSK